MHHTVTNLAGALSLIRLYPKFLSVPISTTDCDNLFWNSSVYHNKLVLIKYLVIVVIYMYLDKNILKAFKVLKLVLFQIVESCKLWITDQSIQTGSLKQSIHCNKCTINNTNYHNDSEDDDRSGCRNVSHCHQQFFSELHSPGRSHYTNYWYSWVQTIYYNTNYIYQQPISSKSQVRPFLE